MGVTWQQAVIALLSRATEGLARLVGSWAVCCAVPGVRLIYIYIRVHGGLSATERLAAAREEENSGSASVTCVTVAPVVFVCCTSVA